MCTQCKYKYLGIKKLILFSSASSQNTFNTSRTPEYHTCVPTPPVPALPDHPLLQRHLLDVKIQARVVGGQFNLAKTFVSGSMYEGWPKILYMAHKTTCILEPNWVTVLCPNVKQTDSLLVILEGEYAGRFAL